MFRSFLAIVFVAFLVVGCEKPDLRLYPKDAKRKSTASGERVYRENCSNCHGDNGSAASVNVPSIAGTEFVNGDAGKVILSVLYGSDYIERQEGMFKSPLRDMDAYKEKLTDVEVMRLVNYMRTNFQNNAYMITSKDVKKARTLVW